MKTHFESKDATVICVNENMERKMPADETKNEEQNARNQVERDDIWKEEEEHKTVLSSIGASFVHSKLIWVC